MPCRPSRLLCTMPGPSCVKTHFMKTRRVLGSNAFQNPHLTGQNTQRLSLAIALGDLAGDSPAEVFAQSILLKNQQYLNLGNVHLNFYLLLQSSNW